MCDIWKDNKNLKQLSEADVNGLINSLRKLETRKVLMSGGEALLNPGFFRLCAILKNEGIAISLCTTGLTLEKNADQLLRYVDDLVVSIDGDETVHDTIRNMPGAFQKLRAGVIALKAKDPGFRISSRTVIQKHNFRNWSSIIDAGLEMGLDQVSFLPADSSSHAFNREVLWSDIRRDQIIPSVEELQELRKITGDIIINYEGMNGFIAESPEKLRNIYLYYAACHGLGPFPQKKCNAPWVSAVVEADGSVRPCFFHETIGNIRDGQLSEIVNGAAALQFRKDLDMGSNPTCVKCVCSLNLSPGARL
jgi:MoaA/NifB/PqqE/SkfB family radical SAM enzyme